MLGHGRTANIHPLCQFPDGTAAVAQPLKDEPTCRVPEGIQSSVYVEHAAALFFARSYRQPLLTVSQYLPFWDQPERLGVGGSIATDNTIASSIRSSCASVRSGRRPASASCFKPHDAPSGALFAAWATLARFEDCKVTRTRRVHDLGFTCQRATPNHPSMDWLRWFRTTPKPDRRDFRWTG